MDCEGGNLIFRPPSTPGNGYDDCVDSYSGPFCAANPFGKAHIYDEQPTWDLLKGSDYHPDDEDDSGTVDLESLKKAVITKFERVISNKKTHKKIRIDDDQETTIGKLLGGIFDTACNKQAIQSLRRENSVRMRRDHHLKNLSSFRRYQKELEVKTGTAVAFSNTIPHRFKTIHSNKIHLGGLYQYQPQPRRLFINFFVVDPDDPLPVTTANTASPAQICSILLQSGFLEGDTSLAHLVTSFLGGYSHGDLLHRTVVRDQARAAMSAGRQHWKTQYFGNAGVLQFFPDARWNENLYDTRFIGVTGRNYEHSAKSTELGSGM